MLQLLYLAFTAPRRDDDAIAAWKQRMHGMIENRRLRPETVFGDEWMLRLYRNHPRRQPLTEATLDAIDVDAAFEIYADRFRDAGDFTFVIVGNFEPEAIRPLVATYLGGLPAGGRSESWRDVGAVRAEGTERFEVRKGLEPKSQVRLSLSGAAPWSRQADHDLSSLAGVLRIRLREVLREDKGATYGVGVFGGVAREPREEFNFDVSFGCAPDNV
jgi:zinc protease